MNQRKSQLTHSQVLAPKRQSINYNTIEDNNEDRSFTKQNRALSNFGIRTQENFNNILPEIKDTHIQRASKVIDPSLKVQNQQFSGIFIDNNTLQKFQKFTQNPYKEEIKSIDAYTKKQQNKKIKLKAKQMWQILRDKFIFSELYLVQQ